MPLITAWAALVCGTFYMLLTLQVIRARGSQKVALGDGDDPLMLRRIRGQANAAEQMPLTLLVLLLAELMGGSTVILAPLAVIFTAGRLAHGYAFGWLEHSRPLRVYGMVASITGSLGLLLYLGALLIVAIV